MSKNRNRTQFKKTNNNRLYKIILLKELYPPYWGDGKIFNEIYPEKKRMYRTWKYNRKTQYKCQK